MANSVVEEIAAKAAMLPLEQQKQALEYIESLAQSVTDKSCQPRPHRKLMGTLAHLNVKLTAEDIKEARRELWRGYMGDDEQDEPSSNR